MLLPKQPRTLPKKPKHRSGPPPISRNASCLRCRRSTGKDHKKPTRDVTTLASRGTPDRARTIVRARPCDEHSQMPQKQLQFALIAAAHGVQTSRVMTQSTTL